MKKRLVLLVMLLFCLVVIGTVSAQNMSITDMGILGSQTIQVYANNGTLLGTYNTTTNGISLPTGDFVLLIKPKSSDAIQDPRAFLSAGFAFIETNAIPLVMLFFVVGFFWRKK
jgi:hypothetical protein